MQTDMELKVKIEEILLAVHRSGRAKDRGLSIIWARNELLQLFKEMAEEGRKEERADIGHAIPELFMVWREYVDKAYKSKKSTVILGFPDWLEEFLVNDWKK